MLQIMKSFFQNVISIRICAVVRSMRNKSCQRPDQYCSFEIVCPSHRTRARYLNAIGER